MAGDFSGLLEPDLPVDSEVTPEMEAMFDALGEDEDVPSGGTDDGEAAATLGSEDDAGDAAAARSENGEVVAETSKKAEAPGAEADAAKAGETPAAGKDGETVGDVQPAQPDLLTRAMARGAELLSGDLAGAGKDTGRQAASSPVETPGLGTTDGQGPARTDTDGRVAATENVVGEVGGGGAPTLAELLPDSLMMGGEQVSKAEVLEKFGDDFGDVLAAASVAAARRVSSEMLAQLRAERPAALETPVVGGVSAEEATALQARVEALDGMVQYETFLRSVARQTEHKDVAAIVEDERWDAWVDTQSPAVQRLVASGRVEDADLALKLYKAEASKAVAMVVDTKASTAHAETVALHSSTLDGSDAARSGGGLSESEQRKLGWDLPDPDDAD